LVYTLPILRRLPIDPARNGVKIRYLGLCLWPKGPKKYSLGFQPWCS
jgi:hypothetical protein